MDWGRAALERRSHTAAKVLQEGCNGRRSVTREVNGEEEKEEPSGYIIATNASWAVNRSAHDAHDAHDRHVVRGYTQTEWPHRSPHRSDVMQLMHAGVKEI
jgi:hypothetical protein